MAAVRQAFVLVLLSALCSAVVENYYLKPTPPIPFQAMEMGRNGAQWAGDWFAVAAPRDSTCGPGVFDGPQLDTERGCPNSGAVLVYEQTGSTMELRGFIKPEDVAVNEVALTTTHVAVAGSLGVHVYTLAPGTRPAFQQLITSPLPILFGASVAMHGTRIVVGSPWDSGCGEGVDPPDMPGCTLVGAAFVYSYDGTEWTQEAFLKPLPGRSQDSMDFGRRVAINDMTIAVAAPTDTSCSTVIDGGTCSSTTPHGSVHTFNLNGGTWTTGHYLKAPTLSSRFGGMLDLSENVDGKALLAAGQAIGSALNVDVFQLRDGVASNDTVSEVFTAASVLGGTYNVAVTHEKLGMGGDYVNGVEIWGNSSSGWVKEEVVTPAVNTSFEFGKSVDLAYADDGTLVLAVGIPGDVSCGQGVGGERATDTCTGAGAAAVFMGTGAGGTMESFAFIKPPLSVHRVTDFLFGSDVATDNDWVVVGAYGDNICGSGLTSPPSLSRTSDLCPGTGAVTIYSRTGSVLTHSAYIKSSEFPGNGEFGRNVDVASNTVAIGAPWDSQCEGPPPCPLFSGGAEIWRYVMGTWVFDALVKAPSVRTNSFLRHVSLSPSGNRLALADTLLGDIFVYDRDGTTGAWTLTDTVSYGPDLGKGLKFATEDRLVALLPTTAFEARVYDYNATTGRFALTAALTEPTGNLGRMGAGGGRTLAAEGDVVVVGGPLDSECEVGVNPPPGPSTCAASGAAHVFWFNGTAWTYAARLKGTAFPSANFGYSVALAGGHLVVGAPKAAVAEGRVFTYSVDAATGGVAAGEEFGSSTAGLAYAASVGTEFGGSVAVAPDGLCVVGAPLERSCGSGASCDRTNVGCPGSGAAFTFSAAPTPDDCGPLPNATGTSTTTAGGSTTADGTTGGTSGTTSSTTSSSSSGSGSEDTSSTGEASAGCAVRASVAVAVSAAALTAALS